MLSYFSHCSSPLQHVCFSLKINDCFEFSLWLNFTILPYCCYFTSFKFYVYILEDFEESTFFLSFSILLPLCLSLASFHVVLFAILFVSSSNANEKQCALSIHVMFTWNPTANNLQNIYMKFNNVSNGSAEMCHLMVKFLFISSCSIDCLYIYQFKWIARYVSFLI